MSSTIILLSLTVKESSGDQGDVAQGHQLETGRWMAEPAASP